MKHLRKKYIRLISLTDSVSDLLNYSSVDEKEIPQIVKDLDNRVPFLITEGKEMIQSFQYKNNKKIYLIPEPDPIVIYFDTGRAYLKRLKRDKIKLLEKLNQEHGDAHETRDAFYYYYSASTSFVVFVFIALEAFINKMIPYSFEYRKSIGNKKVELYNKIQIQRHIEFMEKIKQVLPAITSKSFAEKKPKIFHRIEELKNFRDEIVHTKSHEGSPTSNFYQSLYVKSLDFDYENTLYAAREFISFYEGGLIEECDCGVEMD